MTASCCAGCEGRSSQAARRLGRSAEQLTPIALHEQKHSSSITAPVYAGRPGARCQSGASPATDGARPGDLEIAQFAPARLLLQSRRFSHRAYGKSARRRYDTGHCTRRFRGLSHAQESVSASPSGPIEEGRRSCKRQGDRRATSIPRRPPWMAGMLSLNLRIPARRQARFPRWSRSISTQSMAGVIPRTRAISPSRRSRSSIPVLKTGKANVAVRDERCGARPIRAERSVMQLLSSDCIETAPRRAGRSYKDPQRAEIRGSC